jgi:hypothetical protein
MKKYLSSHSVATEEQKKFIFVIILKYQLISGSIALIFRLSHLCKVEIEKIMDSLYIYRGIIRKNGIRVCLAILIFIY